MSERWVIDASVGLAWVHPAQATEATDRLLGQLTTGVELVVPELWFQEIANALLVLQRRKKLKPDERCEALALLRTFHLQPDFEAAALAFDRLSELAEQHDLSVYDATYLELAVRMRLPLGTNDGPLRAAARACQVPLLIQ